MERLKLQKKIFEFLHEEVLDIDIRNFETPIIIDRLAELAIRICEQIKDYDTL